MSRKSARSQVALAVLVAAAVAGAPAAAQVCGPDPDGRVASADYRDTTIVWEPLVEYDRMVLTIGGPCEDIVHEFRRGEQIVFDLREIERVLDGTYTWELRRAPIIDESTRKALASARATNDDSIWWNLFQKGAIPEGPYVTSESFRVIQGIIVPPGGQEEGAKSGMVAARAGAIASRARAQGPDGPLAHVTAADQVIPDDLIVQGSLCVGFDCVNNESFSFDTIRMKENNLRIKFDDTSVTAGFPANDWQLTANDSASGGASKFSIEDISGARVPFTVRAGAPTNSLFIDSTGRLGLRTATPVLDLHINTSNTPGIRLEQNNSGGFTAQTWDIAGNEANFFVRDVTGGSRLPFRIRPNAPTSSVDISADGDVGIGTASPDASLNVRRSDGTALLHVEETSGTNAARTLFTLENNGNTSFTITDSGTNGQIWQLGNLSSSGVDGFVISRQGDGENEFIIKDNGDVFIENGTVQVTSSREAKENFTPLDAGEVLAKLSALPITAWTYKKDEGKVRHVGPMAEDFYAAFGLGTDDKHVSFSDTAGVALLAVQGLQEDLAAKHEEIAELRRQLAELRRQVEGLSRPE